MRIAIDISSLHQLALKRGVGFYAQNLYRTLNTLNRLRKEKDEYFLKKTRKEQYKADLIHYPYFDPFFLTLPLNQKPFIVTIHDLIPLKFPQNYPTGIKGKIKWQIQKRIVKSASAIITDSVNSKKDIEEIIGYPSEKIFPIYLAVGEEFKILDIKILRYSGIKEKYKLPENFLLYVGDLNWNKNLKSLVKAFQKLKIKNEKLKITDQNLKLVFIGSSFKKEELGELKELRTLIKELELEAEVKFLGFIPTSDLVKIYNLATLYIQPSFYEGFGLPVLEAMSCGCPVLCSKRGSLPEVGGGAVQYFNPYKEGDLENKLAKLLTNKNILRKLSKLGLKQAKKFSWQKTALETKRVYEKIISEK